MTNETLQHFVASDLIALYGCTTCLVRRDTDKRRLVDFIKICVTQSLGSTPLTFNKCIERQMRPLCKLRTILCSSRVLMCSDLRVSQFSLSFCVFHYMIMLSNLRAFIVILTVCSRMQYSLIGCRSILFSIDSRQEKTNNPSITRDSVQQRRRT